MGWHYVAGWVGWLVMTMVMLAFWVLVVLAVVGLFRGVGTSRAPANPPTRPAPVDILAERFARGDIDAEEHLMRARVLREASPGENHLPLTP